MLKRLLVAIVTTIVVLFAINLASLSVIPYVHQVIECSTQKQGEDHPSHNDCTLSDGIVAQGFVWIFERHSEFWTAIGTIVIGFFTATLWHSTSKIMVAGDQQIRISRKLSKAARSANKSTHEIERAYLTGGGGPLKERPMVFQLVAENIGKTPAFLDAFAVQSCDLSALPPEPTYVRQFFPDRLAPREKKAFHEFVISLTNNPVVYGRFWYRDIWKEEHSFGFILSIRDGNSFPDIMGVSPLYTHWT